MSTIIIAVILSAATAKAQNYPPFLHKAEQALVNEFLKLEQQDWQEWREQQEWRLRQADDEDDMRPAGAFKTTTRTATAEQSFWPYARSAHGVATSSTVSAIDLIRREALGVSRGVLCLADTTA
jgi:hypothetical protein